MVFEKNAKFFAENCRKSQKIVIITSTPGGQYCEFLKKYPEKGESFDNFGKNRINNIGF
jgi:hypothetical protein